MLHYYHYACAGHAVDLVKGSMPFKYLRRYTVDLVQGLRGPGPATFWTWCHFTPWTWSNHHAPQTPQSHTRWTWSTTQNHTAAKYRPHQGQNTVTPRPNSPWTWSKALCHSSTLQVRWAIHSGPGPGPSRTWSSHFLDVVPFHPLDLVQPPCPTDTSEPHSVDLVHHTESHRGQISATPRPKISHTSAKFPLDLVQGLRGPGPPPIK